MKSRVVISLSSPKPSHNWSFGKEALRILYDADASLQPDRVGLDDTDLRKKLPCAFVEDVQPLWARQDEYEDPYELHENLPDQSLCNLYWKRHRPLRARGTFNFASYHKVWDKHLPSRAKLLADYTKRIDYIGIFKAWCELYEPHQGYLHFLTKDVVNEERHEIAENNTDLERQKWELSRGITVSKGDRIEKAVGCFEEGSVGPLHDERTFDLGCISFFSLEMLDHKTVEKLRAADIHVSPFANGHFVNLSADISELQGDFDGFVKRRVLAKSIMGPEKFVLQM